MIISRLNYFYYNFGFDKTFLGLFITVAKNSYAFTTM